MQKKDYFFVKYLYLKRFLLYFACESPSQNKTNPINALNQIKEL